MAVNDLEIDPGVEHLQRRKGFTHTANPLLAEVGPPDHDVVVYCRSGHRSTAATHTLRDHGFTKVHNLGPMTAW